MSVFTSIWDILSGRRQRYERKTKALAQTLYSILKDSTHIDHRRSSELYELCKVELQSADEDVVRGCALKLQFSTAMADMLKDSIENRVQSVLLVECMRRNDLGSRAE